MIRLLDENRNSETPRVVLEVEPDSQKTLEFLQRWIADARKRRAEREGREAA